MSKQQKPTPAEVISDNNAASDRELMHAVLDEKNAYYGKWSTLTCITTLVTVVMNIVVITHGYQFQYDMGFLVYAINLSLFFCFNGRQLLVRSMALRLDESPRDFIEAFSYNANKETVNPPPLTLFTPKIVNKLPTPSENLKFYLDQQLKFAIIRYACAFAIVVLMTIAENLG